MFLALLLYVFEPSLEARTLQEGGVDVRVGDTFQALSSLGHVSDTLSFVPMT